MQGLRICKCLYYGAALLLLGDVYVALSSGEVREPLVRGI